jgi:hypothetical protein
MNTKTETKDDEQYEYRYKSDYESDWTIHENYINKSFDAYEAMLLGQVYDSVSSSVDGSKITDSYAATLAIERAARVMGKLPEGQTMPMTKADEGKAMFMDILRQKWVYPNANAQHNFDTKLRLWQLYSSVYGYMPMFYDWNISSTGYVGPDCWLWSPRNLVPQQGRTSIKDMEYVTALTWVSKKYLQNILDGITEEEDGGWDAEALRHLVEIAGDSTTDNDVTKDTITQRNRTPQATKRGICLATRYEAGEEGEWITFAPDNSCVQIRKIANPHKNGRIPFVIKYSQPLYDSFYGLGDFQRAKPLQFARDGLTNFYFKGIKMNLIPPIIANANGVVKHTLDYREGAVMLETIPNSIRRMETSNAGLATYQAAQSNLTGSLLSLYGSQNASIPGAETLNPSQGKTPAAISLYGDKEATRDGQERMYLESAVEELTDGFNSLIVNIGTEKIPVTMFADDIADIIKAGHTDLEKMFKNFQANETETGGVLQIDPASLKGVEYRFNIEPGSTAKMNKDAQRQALEGFVGVISKLQNVIQNDPRVKVEWPKIMKAYEGLSDIPGVSEFITVNEDAKPQPAPEAAVPATAIKTPDGKIYDLSDLIKLYLGTSDEGLRSQLITAIGFTPTPATAPTPEPVVTASGHLFSDPHIGAAADALGAASPSAPAPEPVIHAGGMYNDPHLGAVAQAITKL